MSTAEILSRVAAELALFAGVGFLLFGLNDLAVDIIYFGRRLWRSLTIYNRYPRSFAAELAAKAEAPGFIAVFVPAGALWVLAVARWRTRWVLGPLGIAALALYSVVIELGQLAAARIGRACDVTDMVDNVAGALLGGLLGIVLALVLQPWRR